ncbi:MAG: DctP family TRAP transporter solute-binding subunit [Lachnospirales bacterium]
MKKMFAIVFSMTFFVTSCGGSSKTVGSIENNTSSKNTENDDSIILDFGITAGVKSNEYYALKHLDELLIEKSDGALKLNIYPDSQLGEDIEMIEKCMNGELDMTFAETGRLGEWVPDAEIFQLPYIFDNFEELQSLLFDSEEGQALLSKFEEELSFVFLDTAYNGTREVTSNFPIESVYDMEGMKLRVPNAKANIEAVRNIGAIPVVVPYVEVYKALQTGEVDGQGNPLSSIKASKFYEVQSHIALTNHILNDQGYLISKSTYNSLPTNLREILVEAVQETTEYHSQLFMEDESNLIDFFKGEGVVVTNPDMSDAKAMMQPSYDRYLSECSEVGQALYDKLMNE